MVFPLNYNETLPVRPSNPHRRRAVYAMSLAMRRTVCDRYRTGSALPFGVRPQRAIQESGVPRLRRRDRQTISGLFRERGKESSERANQTSGYKLSRLNQGLDLIGSVSGEISLREICASNIFCRCILRQLRKLRILYHAAIQSGMKRGRNRSPRSILELIRERRRHHR